MVLRTLSSRGIGLSSCDTGARSTQTSVAVMRTLSCPAARGGLVPRPEMEPVSPALQGEFLTTGPPGKSLISCSNSCPANHHFSTLHFLICKIGTVITYPQSGGSNTYLASLTGFCKNRRNKRDGWTHLRFYKWKAEVSFQR